MKKGILRLSVVLLVSIITFSGCTKKGEDDPFLSMRSRTSRLAGEWTLSEYEITYTENNSTWGTYTSKTVYNGATYSRTYTQDGNSSTSDPVIYSESLTIEKDGTWQHSSVEEGEISGSTGNWMWASKNKDLDLKDKEAVILTEASSTYNGETSTYTGIPDEGNIMVIKQLANKELVFEYSYSETDSDGDTYSVNGTRTYTQN